VNGFTPISDHCPISCSLLTHFYDHRTDHNTKLDPLPGKFIWDEEAINRYTTNIQSLNVKQKFQVFMSEDHSDCESAVSNFNSIKYDTALMSTKFIKRRTVKRQITSKKKPWFSESCQELYKTVNRYCSLLNTFPGNGSYRKAFYSFRSKFRRKCKMEERKYKKTKYMMTCILI
jgi:hypothetical protein